MSQFLGRQDCIDSLRKDLVDLQGAIVDVFSRTGPVRYSSWKFPDKLSCNLNMVSLMEQYDFVEGEEAFNQHSHIVLLELVVDRLLLLLQSFNAYVELQKSSHENEQTQQRGCLSIGLVVLKYWNNLIQGTCKENKTKTKLLDCDKMEKASSASALITSWNECSPSCSSATSSISAIKISSQHDVPSSSTHRTPCLFNIQSNNVSCQTVDSSLVPCSACHQVQAILKETGEVLVELLEGEGMPSSLQPLLKAVEDTLEPGQMTAGDVAQWACEQHRDLRRLAKHLHDVRDTVRPLTKRLVAAEEEQKNLRSQLESAKKELEQEAEKYKSTILELESSLQKAQKSMKEIKERLTKGQQRLKREISSLEKNNAKHKEIVVEKQSALQAVECERNALQDKLRNLHIEEEACFKLQQKIRQLEGQIFETQLLLDKENAKYQSACRQQESLQAKQKCLLERVDAIDEEREELQRLLGHKEEREINLQNQLQQISEEKDQLQAQLTQQLEQCLQLQKEKLALETDKKELRTSMAELEEYVLSLKENERLLAAFPELSSLDHAQPQSTGDVLWDMEQQLKANNIRISVLQQENATLRNGIVKLRESSQPTVKEESSPQQYWSFSPPSRSEAKPQNHQIYMHNSPLQSSSAVQLSCTGRGVRGQESALMSPETGDGLSSSTPAYSSGHTWFQSLRLETSGAPAKATKKAQTSSYLNRNLKNKKK